MNLFTPTWPTEPPGQTPPCPRMSLQQNKSHGCARYLPMRSELVRRPQTFIGGNKNTHAIQGCFGNSTVRSAGMARTTDVKPTTWRLPAPCVRAIRSAHAIPVQL